MSRECIFCRFVMFHVCLKMIEDQSIEIFDLDNSGNNPATFSRIRLTAVGFQNIDSDCVSNMQQLSFFNRNFSYFYIPDNTFKPLSVSHMRSVNKFIGQLPITTIQGERMVLAYQQKITDVNLMIDFFEEDEHLILSRESFIIF